MADLHRLDRRSFLSDIGRRTLAVAVVGPAVLAACSSDGTVTPDGSEPSDTTSADASSTDASSAPTDSEPSAAAGQSFRWERVELGFVSAYLIARGNEVAIVDTGTPGNVAIFDQALTTVGASWGDVKHVILTHKHGDHVGGLPDIVAAAANAAVYIGEADLDGVAPGAADAINDGDEIFDLQIIGTPGHTPGHISVLDQAAGFLVAGDALNEEGGTVLGPNPDFTANMDQANASVRRLAERSFETVVFGHGEPVVGSASDAVVALAQTL